MANELDKFWEMLVDTCPVVEVHANEDSIFADETPKTEPSTSNTELLDKISALEKMIAEMKNVNNGDCKSDCDSSR